MNDAVADRPATPWHVWVVGILATLWNSGGAFDYSMTQMRDEGYMAAFTPEQLEYFYGFPAWADAFWALGVWGAMLGSILILFRSRFAFSAFVVSLIGLVGTLAYQLTANMPDSLNTPFVWMFSAVIWISILLLIWYTRRMTVAGVLR